jgi:hypothetical protein
MLSLFYIKKVDVMVNTLLLNVKVKRLNFNYCNLYI